VLAEYTGYTVIGVEYRLAPEHPFPEGLIDCYTALDWVSNTNRISNSNQPLAVGGDSAGANLAIAASLMASHRETAEIDHQILAYPATRFPPSSPTDSNSEYFLTTADVAWFWDNYLQTGIDGYHQYAAPLETRSVSELPPTTLLTAEFDPLRKDGQLLADRLSTEGVTHNYHHYPSMPHGFLTLLGKPHVPIAHQACEQIAAELPRE
jgi:acetyl esterase